MEYCRMKPVLLQAWSPLAQGALTGNLDGKPENIRKTGALVQEYARAHETTPEAILLAWLGSNGADVKSVKLLEVPFPSVGAALDQNRIDAGNRKNLLARFHRPARFNLNHRQRIRVQMLDDLLLELISGVIRTQVDAHPISLPAGAGLGNV